MADVIVTRELPAVAGVYPVSMVSLQLSPGPVVAVARKLSAVEVADLLTKVAIQGF
jgi:hypothetical protein